MKIAKNAGMAAVAAIWLALALWAWLCPAKAQSVSERRPLAQFPKLSAEQLLEGKFMSDFEEYSLDQFPLRDRFRTLKAAVQYGVLRQQDNNGIYLSQGHAAKLEYPLNEASIDHALKVFQKIYEKNLQNANVYLSIVPDKGYYLAESGGYPAMDYNRLFDKMTSGMPYAKYINLTDTLRAEDYYRTDTHWRQEAILPAAQKLCSAMGVAAPEMDDYTLTAAENPFYGVYYGQAALPMAPDTLYTMENDLLKSCRVLNYETGNYGSIYDSAKLVGDDLYEVFLSGSVSLLTIENPHAATDRELILFRDSFGSSIAPLLVQGYKAVTLVDIRYISSAMLDRFIDFGDKDVLFLYSTLVLNNSSQLQ